MAATIVDLPRGIKQQNVGCSSGILDLALISMESHLGASSDAKLLSIAIYAND
jgi:hypothetical protein